MNHRPVQLIVAGLLFTVALLGFAKLAGASRPPDTGPCTPSPQGCEFPPDPKTYHQPCTPSPQGCEFPPPEDPSSTSPSSEPTTSASLTSTGAPTTLSSTPESTPLGPRTSSQRPRWRGPSPGRTSTPLGVRSRTPSTAASSQTLPVTGANTVRLLIGGAFGILTGLLLLAICALTRP